MLLKEGIGWGYMPEPMVREDVKGGRLVKLDMPESKSESIRLYAIYRTDTPPGCGGLLAHFPVRGPGGGTEVDRGYPRRRLPGHATWMTASHHPIPAFARHRLTTA
jgi:hypothetical protein